MIFVDRFRLVLLLHLINQGFPYESWGILGSLSAMKGTDSKVIAVLFVEET